MENQSLLRSELGSQEALARPGQRGIFRRIAAAWLRFSGPNIQRFTASLADQERLRRARSLSAILPLFFIAGLIIAPTAIPVPTYWIPVCFLLVLGCVALLFNRMGYVTLGGISSVLAIDITLVILLKTLPTGIRNSNIPDFDLFLLSVLVGGIVLPRRLLPFSAVLNLLLIFALFTFSPHDLLLNQEIKINQGGFAYSELSDAFLLQIVGTAIAWLSAWSVDNALLRASRAEELAEARQRLGEQTYLLANQNARLEYGLNVLKDAHARFANGDYKARANLQDNELSSLAFSFNLLAERLNRVAQEAQSYERLEQAFQQFFVVQETVIHGGFLRSLTPTGTLIDKLYPWLKQYHQLRQTYVGVGASAEKIRLGLLRQRTLLTQLTLSLDQAHAQTRQTPASHPSTLEYVEKAQQTCGQIDDVGKQCMQETRQLDQLLKK